MMVQSNQGIDFFFFFKIYLSITVKKLSSFAQHTKPIYE